MVFLRSKWSSCCCCCPPARLPAHLQACHDLVPPETLAPVIRQLVDQFVHDRARPEVGDT